MSIAPPPLRNLLDAAQRRYNRARPGSVLILVIVLLVLLALLGTAYLSTSRNDRLSSASSYQNATVDQYGDGIAQLVQGVLVDGLFDHSGAATGTTTYRYRYCDCGTYNSNSSYYPGDIVIGSNGFSYLCTTANNLTAPSNPATGGAGWTQTFYRNFDSIGFNSNSSLAERFPMYNTAPYWPTITPLLLTSSSFEDPTQPLPQSASTFVAPSGSPSYNYYPSFSAAGYPALATTAGGTAIVACDADGDGVADSFLFRIPGAYSDGLTWYAGIRVIDNNSAINANTAGSNNPDAYGLFPADVSLTSALTAGDAITNLINYKINGADGVHPVDDAYTTAPTSPRIDYQFLSQDDALNSQLVRRTRNPGLGATNATTVGARFNAVPDSETAAMAYHFCLRNLNEGTNSPSMLELMLPNSTLAGSTTISAPFNSVSTWFSTNFNQLTDAPGTSKPIRTMLVTRNPVSNYIPVVYDPNNTGEPLSPFMLPYGTGTDYGLAPTNPWSHYRGTWTATPVNSSGNPQPYIFNDIVVENGRTYICVNATGATTDPQNGGTNLYGNYANWQLQPWTQNPVKTNVNTATFRELFRAYWSVMAGNLGNVTPFGFENPSATSPATTNVSPSYNPYTNTDPQKMFRSPIRDPNYAGVGNANTVTRLDSCNTMLLRAALAAVNTLGLRGQTQDVISRTIYLNATLNGAGPNTPALADNYTNNNFNIEARVYSNAPQPFISEVFVDNDTSTGSDPNSGGKANQSGYIGVEIYNPYPFAITMNNWQIALIQRNPGQGYPTTGYTLNPIATIPVIAPSKVPVIPANGTLLLENLLVGSAKGTDAQYRPAAAFPNSAATSKLHTSVYVSGLYQALTLGGELVILRPRSANGTITSNSIDPDNIYNEANIQDLVPVDSYDFTGFPPPSATATQYTLWHYYRGKQQTAGLGQAFKCVYPGRYSGLGTPRQVGTVAETFAWPAGPAALSPAANFTFLTATTSTSTYAFEPIQIFNSGMPGPFPLVASPGNQSAQATATFPFGTFARNGDILDVPYIGAYRLSSLQNNQIIELNSLPMDAAFADDCDTTDDANENIGRFCPLSAAGTTLTDPDWYSWTRNLFTYLTVQTPTDDYMPSFDPGPDETDAALKYTPGSAVPTTALPSPVNSSDATLTNHTTQDNVGVDGLININTAPWKVLATLNMASGNAALNQSLAQAIVQYRQKFGPFTSILDLNKVYDISGGTTNSFQNGWGTITIGAVTTSNGIIGPYDPSFPSSSGVANNIPQDFQGQFANLTRISNLITTRSDSYTVYICVQGWQNANSTTLPPTLKVIRRYAFVADRSAISALQQSRFLKTLTVPNN